MRLVGEYPVVNCFQKIVFLISSKQQSHYWPLSCLVWLWIAFKILYDLWHYTINPKLLSSPSSLWIAFKIVSSISATTQQLINLSHTPVVNCFQNCIFDILNNRKNCKGSNTSRVVNCFQNCTFDILNNALIEFVPNYDNQCCELLSKLYLWYRS